MKIKKKAAVAAAVFAAAMNFSACAYAAPEDDYPDHSSGEVYDTPAEEWDDDISDTASGNNDEISQT